VGPQNADPKVGGAGTGPQNVDPNTGLTSTGPQTPARPLRAGEIVRAVRMPCYGSYTISHEYSIFAIDLRNGKVYVDDDSRLIFGFTFDQFYQYFSPVVRAPTVNLLKSVVPAPSLPSAGTQTAGPTSTSSQIAGPTPTAGIRGYSAGPTSTSSQTVGPTSTTTTVKEAHSLSNKSHLPLKEGRYYRLNTGQVLQAQTVSPDSLNVSLTLPQEHEPVLFDKASGNSVYSAWPYYVIDEAQDTSIRLPAHLYRAVMRATGLLEAEEKKKQEEADRTLARNTVPLDPYAPWADVAGHNEEPE
jgi:hypothetical protein